MKVNLRRSYLSKFNILNTFEWHGLTEITGINSEIPTTIANKILPKKGELKSTTTSNKLKKGT